MTDKTPEIAAPTDFRPEARAPRGFADKRAGDIAIEQRLITTIAGVYESYGFEALQTSAFEYADALGKFLPDADRPNVGVFALEDDADAEGKNGQWMALRYDLTAPLARFAAQNWETLPKPFRRYAFGSVWRNEKPGPGRLREFTQCDADTVGTDRPEADAEMIAMAVAGYKALGLPVRIRINNRKLLNGLLTQVQVTDPNQVLGILRAIDKMDRFGLDGVRDLLMGGRKDESGDFTKGAGLTDRATGDVLQFVKALRPTRLSTLDNIANVVGATPDGGQGVAELSAINTALTAMGVREDEAIFDPGIVRGLEYYTGPVFEAELLQDLFDAKGNRVPFGSMGGGGRYDDLVARFTGERTPATGFSFGVSRLTAAMTLMDGQKGVTKRGPVVIIAFSEADMGEYFAFAAEIRAAGIAAEVYLGRSGMKAQMKYADRRDSPAVVMMGEDELKNGTVTIKDLDLGRELSTQITDNQAWRDGRPGQVALPRSEAINYLKKLIELA